MADTKVALSRSYAETGRPVSELVFRTPRWSDFVELGDIEEWQQVDGRAVLVRYPQIVAHYAERCLQAPATAADLAVLDLADTFAVHRAIRDFFVSARSSRPPPTSSSGDTARASARSGG